MLTTCSRARWGNKRVGVDLAWSLVCLAPYCMLKWAMGSRERVKQVRRHSVEFPAAICAVVGVEPTYHYLLHSGRTWG